MNVLKLCGLLTDYALQAQIPKWTFQFVPPHLCSEPVLQYNIYQTPYSQEPCHVAYGSFTINSKRDEEEIARTRFLEMLVSAAENGWGGPLEAFYRNTNIGD